MNSILYELSTGDIIAAFNHDAPLQAAGAGQALLRTEQVIQPDEWRVESGELVPKAMPQPDPMVAVRLQRDALLTNTDWTQLPDAPLSASQLQAFRDYRQALRDLPETDPIVWPDKPSLDEPPA